MIFSGTNLPIFGQNVTDKKMSSMDNLVCRADSGHKRVLFPEYTDLVWWKAPCCTDESDSFWISAVNHFFI